MVLKNYHTKLSYEIGQGVLCTLHKFFLVVLLNKKTKIVYIFFFNIEGPMHGPICNLQRNPGVFKAIACGLITGYFIIKARHLKKKHSLPSCLTEEFVRV